MTSTVSANGSVRQLLEREAVTDPEVAIRACVDRSILEYVSHTQERPPFDMKVLASFRGMTLSDRLPTGSKDSEIIPSPDLASFELRINPDRPRVRQRFSIGHEIGHTFFPDCATETRHRCAKDRLQFEDSNEVEYLCDLAASLLVLPSPWFDEACSDKHVNGELVASICSDFSASREATLIRLVRKHKTSAAVVFLSVKLKPIERRALDGPDLFPEEAKQAEVEARTLRVDYSVRSASFSGFLKPNKSVSRESIAWRAAEFNESQEGLEAVEFGPWSAPSRVFAIPLRILGEPKEELLTNRVAVWVEPIAS